MSRSPQVPARVPNVLEAIFLDASGRKETEAAGVLWRGHRIPAPGFSAETLERLIERGFDEGVYLASTGCPGTFHVTRPGSSSMHTASRSACSCPAGRLGKPCKHRALVCLALTVIDLRLRKP